MLDLIRSHLFTHIKCSNGRDPVTGDFEPAFTRLQEYALERKLIQIDHKLIRWFFADMDHADAKARALACKARPNIIIENPANGHCHVGYRWAIPFHLDTEASLLEHGGRHSSVVWSAMCCRWGLINALDADEAYHAHLVKNPFHAEWITTVVHDHAYTFADIRALVDVPAGVKRYYRKGTPRKVATQDLSDVAAMRKRALFDALRTWSYPEKSNHSSYEAFHAAILVQAHAMNHDFPIPMAKDRVIDTAKRVARWTWTRYRPSTNAKHVDRGAAKIDSGLDLKMKQQQAGVYSASIRSESTVTRMVKAISDLRASDAKVTQKDVATKAEVSLPTAKRYWNSDVIMSARTGPIPVQTAKIPPSLSIEQQENTHSLKTPNDTFDLKESVEALIESEDQTAIAAYLDGLRSPDRKKAERLIEKDRMEQIKEKLQAFKSKKYGRTWTKEESRQFFINRNVKKKRDRLKAEHKAAELARMRTIMLASQPVPTAAEVMARQEQSQKDKEAMRAHLMACLARPKSELLALHAQRQKDQDATRAAYRAESAAARTEQAA